MIMRKRWFYASHDLVYISEPLEHALIIAYNQITKTDNLYLARWYKEPEIIPVPFDSSLTNGGSRLVKSQTTTQFLLQVNGYILLLVMAADHR